MTESSPGKIRLTWIVGLIILTVGYRVLISGRFESLANTSPLMAFCFGGGLLLGVSFWWVPVVLLIASDLVLGWIQGTGIGSYTAFNALFFTLAALAGVALSQHRTNWFVLLGGTLACSVAFYVLSNTYVWAFHPGYAKSLAGWWQSQTIGLPGPYPPSWAFLRNALIGDLTWCLVAAPLFFWKPARLPSRLDEPVFA